jgi:hypothetical protein
MSLTITLKPETEAKVKNRAVALGYDIDGYVEKLIEEDSERIRSINEIFAPLHQEVEDSGISDEELDEIFTQARREYYAEKKAKEKL